MQTDSPLSLWERVRVRATAWAIQGLSLSTAVALTPALSQRERESTPPREREPTPDIKARSFD